MKSRVPFLLALVAAALPALAQSGGEMTRRAGHVARIEAVLAPHVPRLGPIPPIDVVEKAPAMAGVSNGKLVVSTGLLAALENDAQLAMVLGYELARANPPQQRDRSRAPSFAAQVGRSAAMGAVAGVVAVQVNEALRGSGTLVRGAASGAATTASGMAMNAALSRRHAKTGAKADDVAVADGMRALLSAGFDGEQACRAWDRIDAASTLGGDVGSYGDRKANAARRRSASRVLSSVGDSGQGVRAGGVVGADTYASAVLAGLQSWHLVSATAVSEPNPS